MTTTLAPRMIAHRGDFIIRKKSSPLIKSATDLSDPNPVEAEHVVNQMRPNFPEKAIKWVKDATWIGPVKVPTDRFDVDDEDSWAAAHEGAKVKDFKKQIKNGEAHLNPVIGVQVPGDDRVKIVDGHHRFLAYRALGKKVPVYVGMITDGSDDWQETHSSQLSQGDSPANKVADTPSKEQDTARLRHYWAHGEGAIKVRWGEPGDFDRCVRHVGKFMDDPQGYCAERHHDALGIWPATHAKEIRDAEKLAVPGIVKVGPHGYIHGWIYVGSADSVGEHLDHPEHGHGVITAAGKGSIDVKHDSGETKHYAATFAAQKAKFVNTGSLEGKTHIANVKAHKDGSVTNKDDGTHVGSVFKNGDGTWAYHHEGSNTMDAKTGYVSKHKAIVGLIAKHNEHADTMSAHGVTEPETNYGPGISVHDYSNGKLSTVKDGGTTVGHVVKDSFGKWGYSHATSGIEDNGFPSKEAAVNGLLLHHESLTAVPGESPFIGATDHGAGVKLTSIGDDTHGVSLNGDPIGHVKLNPVNGKWSYGHGGTGDVSYPSFESKDDAVTALINHHKDSGIVPPMDHSLSQGDAAHEALTHGESHVEPKPEGLGGKPAVDAEGMMEAKTHENVGTIDAKDVEAIPTDDEGNEYDFTHGPSEAVIGHLDTDTGTLTHADGTDMSYDQLDIPDEHDMAHSLVVYHNAKYGTPAAEAAPTFTGKLHPDDLTSDINEDYDPSDPSSMNQRMIHTPTGTVVGYTHYNEPTDHITDGKLANGQKFSMYAANDAEAKQEFAKVHNFVHGFSTPTETPAEKKPAYARLGKVDGDDVSLKPQGLSSNFNLTHTDGTKIGMIEHTPAAGFTGFKHSDGHSESFAGTDKVDAADKLLAYHNVTYGNVPEKPAYAKVGSLQPIETTNHLNGANTGFDIKDTKGTTVGTINFDQDKGQGYSSVTHADGTEVPVEAHTSTQAKQVLLSYHNQKYGDSTLSKPVDVPTAITEDAKVTPASVTANVATLKPTPWTHAGSNVGVKDVVTKQSGDVIAKGSSVKIGTIHKGSFGYGYVATHEDGYTAKYDKKGEAVAGLTTYHNQATAIKQTVKPDATSDAAKMTPITPYDHYKTTVGSDGAIKSSSSATTYGTIKDNGDGTHTVTHASGASWKANTASSYAAKKSLLEGHNQVVDVSHGKPTFTPKTPQSLTLPDDPTPTSTGTVKVNFTHTKLTDGGDLTHTQFKGIKKYTGGWYKTINKQLANDKTTADDDLSKFDADAAAAHAGLDRSEMSHDMILYRGIDNGEAMLGPIGSHVGKTGVQHSFMSTSTNEATANSFGATYPKGMKLIVHAPKGAKGMNVKTFSNYKGEAEVLFQHGTAYRVDSDQLDHNGKRVAHITLIGQYQKDGSLMPYAKYGDA